MTNRGANGTIAGAYAWIIDKFNKGVDIQELNNDRIGDIPIVTDGRVALMHVISIRRVLDTQRGDWYSYKEKGESVYLSRQKETSKPVVHDTSTKVKRKQKSGTVNGYLIPINFLNVLLFVTACTFKDLEWKTLPCITFYSDVG